MMNLKCVCCESRNWNFFWRRKGNAASRATWPAEWLL